MLTTNVNSRILLLSGTEKDYQDIIDTDPSWKPYKGEPAIEFQKDASDSSRIESVKLRVGDGISTYDSLPYVGMPNVKFNQKQYLRIHPELVLGRVSLNTASEWYGYYQDYSTATMTTMNVQYAEQDITVDIDWSNYWIEFWVYNSFEDSSVKADRDDTGTVVQQYWATKKETFVIPEGTYYRLIIKRNTSDTTTSLTDEELVSIRTTLVMTYIKVSLCYNIVNFGDSITAQEVDGSTLSKCIASITGATTYNCGFSGSSISYKSSSLTTMRPFSLAKLIDEIVKPMNDKTRFYYQEHCSTYGTWGPVATPSSLEGIELLDTVYPNVDELQYSDEGEQAPGGSYAKVGSTETFTYYKKLMFPYDTDNFNTLKTVDFRNINLVTIGLGTNDFTGGFKLQNDSNAYDIATYAGALRYVIEKLLTTFPQLRIILVAPTWRYFLQDDLTNVQNDFDAISWSSDEPLEAWWATDGVYLSEYTAVLDTVAKEYHLLSIDPHRELGINKFNYRQWFQTEQSPYGDGTHPNSYGIHQLGSFISDAILKLTRR